MSTGVLILEEQSDLFEVSLLEQVAAIETTGFQRAAEEGLDRPLVIIGSFFRPDRREEICNTLRVLLRGSKSVIVLPPFKEKALGSFLDLTVPLDLERRGPRGFLRVTDALWIDRLGRQEWHIRSDEIIQTSLTAGVIARDEQEQIVILRYQKKNTSAPLVLCTAQLLSYTSLTDEGDRQILLSALIHDIYGVSDQGSTDVLSDKSRARPEDVKATLLALGIRPEATREELRALIRKHLYMDINSDRLEAAVFELADAGYTSIDETVVRAAADRIQEKIDQVGLRALFRELKQTVTLAKQNLKQRS